MKISKKVFLCFVICGALMAAFSPPASGQTNPIPVTVTLDEFGLGLISSPIGNAVLPFFMAPDSGPGGLPNALTYLTISNAPPLLVGDVILLEPGLGTNSISDVIRFNQATAVFYSDVAPGDLPDSLADVGLPSAFYPNAVRIFEVGFEGNNGAVYTPLPGQPGFDPTGTFAISYRFISDVPEPATFALAGLGAAALIIFRRRK